MTLGDLFVKLGGVRRGGEIYFHCIYHDRDRTASLSINADTGLFCCQSCGTGGTAVRLLSDLAGISQEEASGRIQSAGGVKLKKRAVTISEKKFTGRFHPLTTDMYYDYLKRRGFSRKFLDGCGFDLREGAVTDPIWRNRIVAAYRNVRGRLVCVEGRNTDDEAGRLRYFKEGSSANGFVGMEALEGSGPLCLVEGWFDALAVKSVGVPRVLAMGNSFVGSERARLLRSITDHPFVVLDDPGGESRSRVIEKNRAALSPYFKDHDVLELRGGDPNDLLLGGTLKEELINAGILRRTRKCAEKRKTRK